MARCAVVLLVLAGLAACHLVESNHYANKIFNQIHNSMRQFGSSLDHNGMGIFLATVPAGTQFYHGTHQTEVPKTPEWLAFEPEHAMLFSEWDQNGPMLPPHVSARRDKQKPLRPPLSREGYIHTYKTKHPLRLLYVDGQSAAKSDKGTLDTQDRLLLHNYPPIDMPFGERERAEYLCDLATTQFQGRIDGTLRMEGGFEIILCDFAQHLDIVSIVSTKPSSRTGNMFGANLAYYQAVAARYDGIGGGRVKIDYGDFVSMYDHPDAVYFDGQGFPRVNGSYRVELEQILSSVTEMVLGERQGEDVDWQGVTDMIVSRYADRIAFLSSSMVPSLEAFRASVHQTLKPYVDYMERNRTAEVDVCTNQFLPKNADLTTTAGKAVSAVAQTICATFASVKDADVLFDGQARMQQLKGWLAWAKWKKCQACRLDEVCFIPMWPVGDKEYHERPACVNASTPVGSNYWRDERPPKGPPH